MGKTTKSTKQQKEFTAIEKSNNQRLSNLHFSYNAHALSTFPTLNHLIGEACRQPHPIYNYSTLVAV